MVRLTIASQKGGVGKTTVALNLAFALARRGWRTLVIDVDPQGALGLSLSKKITESVGIAEYLEGGVALGDIITRTRLRELSILPVGLVPPVSSMNFHRALEDGQVLSRIQRELSEHFDVFVVDTPSGFTGATMGALRATDQVIAPVQAEPIAARAILRMFDVLASIRGEGNSVKLAGILLTMLQTREQSSLGVAEELWKNVPHEMVFQTTIPRDAAFLDASGVGVPVALLKRRAPPVAMVFDQLAAEFEMQAGLQKEDEDGPLSLVD